MKKKSVKKTTTADKKRIPYESNLNRIPAMHALTDTILLSSQVHVLLLNKKNNQRNAICGDYEYAHY